LFDDSRRLARQILQAALEAVKPDLAVKRYFQTHPDIAARIRATPGRLLVVGAGKAGAPMAAAIAEIFGAQISAGLVIVKYGYTLPMPLPRIELVEAGHPRPDEAGQQATRRILDLAAQAGPDDTILCLLSGGGSALLVQPAAGLSLSDLQSTTDTLLAVGATINEVNTLRKHLSAVKGGRLAQAAAPAALYSLILSDVIGDPLDVIASGPTVPDPTTLADAWAVVARYHLQERLPPGVLARLQTGETPKPGHPAFARSQTALIGNNHLAAQAAVGAARALGFESHLLSSFIEGEAREVGKVIAGLAKGLARNEGTFSRPACMVLGGETTVTLTGDGRGGRNQEMALAAAIALDGWPDVLVVCCGTDGTDGPTDAAGAFADGTTLTRARQLGLDALDYLRRNDSYNFFAPLGDLILTGPTNTNVNDLTLILAG
jgi:hydroxypyruvate reductase